MERLWRRSEQWTHLGDGEPELALSEGAQPCSTIKLSVALAALSEGIVIKDTKVSLGGGYRKIDMTEAIAHSNNAYFEALGRKIGIRAR